MANSINLFEIPCHISADVTVVTNIPNAIGRQFAFNNMLPVPCKLGPLQVATTLYNALVGQTAVPEPNFGNTGTGGGTVGPQRWPLKL